MLELKHITKTFSSVVANDDVSLKIEKGTIHAIVGENGAGKSTVMRIAYGFYNADSGEIFVDGKPANIRNPHDAIALGIGMVHQVELLKALYRDAEILILDEPTAVLSPQETDELFGILRRMKKQGKTIVLITHKLEEVLAISDEVTVMRDGKVVGNVQTAETNTQELARMIVGRDVLLRVEKTEAQARDVVLEVKNLTVEGKHGVSVDDVSFTVRSGEILGIAGIEGNGQTELIETIAGLNHGVAGTVEFENSSITNFSARRIKELGVAHIPEDRHRRGLLLNSDLAENSILGVHYRPPTAIGPFIRTAAVATKVQEIINKFDVRPPLPELAAKSLSGGNQQKLIIGREFVLDPKLLLVSQPTRGVDIGAIEFIHRKLIELRDAGTAVLLVSAELEEVTALADRLLVIRKGKFVGEVDPKVASIDEIGLMMTGG
ncbi:MAG: ABC transporter ATP-binding protein [Acidobacteria bacterium]|nr:ABC transporter ATP-binding protein [Acidobacteriota bacterium]